MRLHPLVATRDCAHCQAWRYDESTGQVALDAQERPIARYKGERLPCDFVNADGTTECAKGKPDAGVALSKINEQVFAHYLECKAVGNFPDDPVVRRNASVIMEVENAIREEKQWKFIAALTGATAGKH